MILTPQQVARLLAIATELVEEYDEGLIANDAGWSIRGVLAVTDEVDVDKCPKCGKALTSAGWQVPCGCRSTTKEG